MKAEINDPSVTKNSSTSSLLLDCLKLVQSFMLTARTDWLNLIVKLRCQYSSLNYFDLTQIKYLMQALHRLLVLQKNDDFDVVRDLLFNVDPNLSLQALQNSLPNNSIRSPDNSGFQNAKIDLKHRWNQFLQEQNECSSKSEMSLMSLVMTLVNLETKALEKLEKIDRKIPEYLIHAGK